MNEQDTKKSVDMVNHPPHYERDGAMECIDEMVLVFGVDATMTFCKLNAWKYRYRAMDKNGIEDIKKSDWYLRKYKELKECGVAAEVFKKSPTPRITCPTPQPINITHLT